MSDQPSRVALLKSLDKLCDEFDRQWSNGNRPAISDYLVQAPDSLRSDVLFELLSIELDARRELGEQPVEADYLSLFPDDLPVISMLFRSPALQDTSCIVDTAVGEKVISEGTVPRLDDYEILEELGRGGMGVVYKAHQKSLDRVVAVKVIRAGEFATQEQIDRFLSEARATAKLQHPGIVNVFEVGQAADQYYFSMEFIDGRTLDELLKADDVPEGRVLEYVREVAEAIQFAHDNGIIHRDIKPSNILIDQFNHVRVMDFGLAKALESGTHLTGSGQILGTPSYMSPEQARGDRTAIDHRTDVYALGAILYRVLSGREVFSSDSVADTVAMIMRDQPTPLRDFTPNVDAGLEDVCLRCLSKDPLARLSSAAEFAEALNNCLRQQQLVSSANQGVENRGWYLAAGAIVGLLLLFAAVIIKIKLDDREIAVSTDDDAKIDIDSDSVTITSGDRTVSIRNGNQSPGHNTSDSNDDGTAEIRDIPTTLAGESALDQIRREDIDPYELACAGDGDPDKAPDGLVAILGQSLGRHDGRVEDVAVSPDGTTIASIAWEHGIRLWDSRSMRQKVLVNGHKLATSLIFTVNSTTLVSCGDEREIRVWDLNDKPRQISAVPVCENGVGKVQVSSLSYSAETHTLGALVRIEGTVPRIRLWKCDERGIPTDDGMTLEANEQARCFAISRAGRMLATGGSDGKLQLWNLSEQPELVAELNSGGAEVHEVAFAPNGKWLAAACDRKGCCVWNVEGDAPSLAFVLKDNVTKGYAYRTVVFSPDSTQVASGLSHWGIHLWEIAGENPSSAVLIEPLASCDFITSIAFTPDGKSVVSGHADRMIRITDMTRRPPEPRLAPKGHWSRFAVVEHVSQDNSSFFTRAADERLIQWTTIDGRITEGSAIELPEGAKLCCVNRQGTVMAAAGVYDPDGTIHIFSLTNGRATLRNRLIVQNIVRRMAMSPDGSHIAITTERGEVQLWDVLHGSHIVVDRFLSDGTSGNGIALSLDGQRLAASGESKDGKAGIRIWDISQSPPKHLTHLDILGSDLASELKFSPDGNQLVQTGDGGVTVTGISGDRPQLVFASNTYENAGQFADFSPDGTMIAMHIAGDTLQLRDTKDFVILREWSLPAPVRPKFAPDSRHLFLGNSNGTVGLLRLKNTETTAPERPMTPVGD